MKDSPKSSTFSPRRTSSFWSQT